jgi:hypothetical protein
VARHPPPVGISSSRGSRRLMLMSSGML